MCKQILFIFVVSFLAILMGIDTLYAQPDTAWTRTYGGSGIDVGRCISPTNDGGFVAVGWTSSFGAGSTDVYLIKINALGDTAWTKTYGGPGEDIGRSVQQTIDGGYIISGYTQSFGAGNRDVYLIKTNAAGDTVWTRTFGGGGADEGYSVLQTTLDSGYIVVGYEDSFGGGGADAWLIKTDVQGNFVWETIWSTNQGEWGRSVQQTADGGYVFTGTTFIDANIFLIKTNSSGGIQWEKSHGRGGIDHGGTVLLTADGGFIIAGWTDGLPTHGGREVYLVKTDSSGNFLWEKNYGGTGLDASEGYSLVQQTPDGGYILTGLTESFGAGGRDVYLIRTDSLGDTLWTQTYGGPGNDEGWSVQQTADGGFILAGNTASYGAGMEDIWLIRLGELPSPQIISTLPIQNELNVAVNTNVSVTFQTDMDASSLNDSTFIIYARSTGIHQGTISYDSQTRTATFDPINDFDDGEVVTAVLTTGILSAQGVALENSHAWSFTVEANQGPATFSSDTTYHVGLHPLSVFGADLNSDGNLDLAAANEDSNSVSVLLNNGDGSFAPQFVLPVGRAPKSVFGVDLDNDGDMDLATANAASGNISLLYNNGLGNFSADSMDVSGLQPNSIFAADLNGDGYPDLTTANASSNNVSVLLNKGDGTFLTDSLYSVDFSPSSLSVADLDNDGDFDITTVNVTAKTVSVISNNGDGTFAPDSVYAVGLSWSMIAADLNGDNYVDLATANFDSNNVSILLNLGNGTFGNQSVYPVGNFPLSIFAADYDGDGSIDLATANLASFTISVLSNNGNGTFAAQTQYPASDPYGLFSADFDSDGDLDIAVTNWSPNAVTLLLNREVTGVAAHADRIPNRFALYQNYPNPFNPVTFIDYDLPQRERVEIVIYNALGQKVKTLLSEDRDPGYHTAVWEATNDSGIKVGTGIYFYRLTAGNYNAIKKMVLLK